MVLPCAGFRESDEILLGGRFGNVTLENSRIEFVLLGLEPSVHCTPSPDALSTVGVFMPLPVVGAGYLSTAREGDKARG